MVSLYFISRNCPSESPIQTGFHDTNELESKHDIRIVLPSRMDGII